MLELEGVERPAAWWNFRVRNWRRIERIGAPNLYARSDDPLPQRPAGIGGVLRCPTCLRRLRRQFMYDAVVCPARGCGYRLNGRDQHLMLKHAKKPRPTG